MRVSAGTHIGPYEVLEPLGAGGMGEVYRARDPRLRRDVALKLLPAKFASDADRMRRFEHEARAAGMLDHPSIVGVHDVGTYEGSPYVVMECLEGETLRQRLDGSPIPLRRALGYALQIAHGLAVAHEKGILHRDIKPENLFLTSDGQVKILDFGIAKLVPFEPPAPVPGDSPTVTSATEPGAVIGTVGYMAPEQLRGLAPDQRSDIFSFGAVLFEMLAGRRAFAGDSPILVLNAILMEDPPPVSSVCPGLPPLLDTLVRRCLEKDPKERCQSIRDCAFALEACAGAGPPAPGAAAAPRGRRFTLASLAALLAGVLVGASGVALFLSRGWLFSPKAPLSPSFRQLTFHRGTVYSARFSADGGTIVYSAAWEGRPKELFALSASGTASRPLGLVNTDIAGLSPSEEMLVILRPDLGFPAGKLARVPLAGGPPRDILENVRWADWNPEGASYAVVLRGAAGERIEYPTGKVLAESDGYVNYPRLSPKGDLVAYLDHPPGSDGGSLVIAGPSYAKRVLSSGWNSIEGLAWSPDGSEVWFTAAREGICAALYAVSLSGKERLLLKAPGRLVLHDLSRRGQAVAERNSIRTTLLGRTAGDAEDRDLSWLDGSELADLSADRKTVLFSEVGEGAGKAVTFYMAKVDGSLPVRLGEGYALEFSPDGQRVLALTNEVPPRLAIWPTGAGETKYLPRGDIQKINFACWLRGGQRILISGSEAGKKSRLFEQDDSGGLPRPMTGEGFSCLGKPISPDGKAAIVRREEGYALLPLAGGAPETVKGLAPGDTPLGWCQDGRSLFVRGRGYASGHVFRVDLGSGRRTPWRDFAPSDGAGVLFVGTVIISPDGATYVYNYTRLLSDLFLIEGVR